MVNRSVSLEGADHFVRSFRFPSLDLNDQTALLNCAGLFSEPF